MSDGIDEVKRRILGRVDLVALIGERTKLSQKAGHFVGLCPFHAEKTPSFYVYPDGYHCFGCHAHGDAIDFTREQQGLGFIDALRWLASKFAIEATELDESRGLRQRHLQEASLYKMMLAAQEYYGQCLAAPPGAQALTYLTERGYSPESLRSFGFGITPPDGAGLYRYLKGKGFGDEAMAACSLTDVSAKDGRPFDFLRRRLTLPIHDPQGRVIAFGGRTLDGSQPKYLNSRDSILFDKSRTLFGFHRARVAMRERGRAIVVEGYMDALMLWQAGFPETVACMGTALTQSHLKLLTHATRQVVLLLDGDSAGRRATLAAVSTALSVPAIAVRTALLPEGEDPDTFVQRQGPDALQALLQGSRDLLDHAIQERIRSTHALGVPELIRTELLPWLALLDDPVQRGFLVARVAQLTGVARDVLDGPLRHGQPAVARQNAGTFPTPEAKAQPVRTDRPLPPMDRMTFDLFGHAFHARPGEVSPAGLRAAADSHLELAPEYQVLFDEIISLLTSGVAPAAQPLSAWTTATDRRLLAVLEKLAATAGAFACQDRQERVAKLALEMKRLRLKGQITDLKGHLGRAAGLGDSGDEARRLLAAITALTRELHAPMKV